MTAILEKIAPFLVATGAHRRTVLRGKRVIGDAAQFGVQRFSANVVAPVALVADQLDHLVAVSSVLPSAHEMTRLTGVATAIRSQVTTFAFELLATPPGPGLPGFVEDPTMLEIALKAAPRS